MKKYFIFLIVYVFIVKGYSQNYGNIWFFGNNAGIDFNSCTPVVLTEGANPGFEGTSSICNNLGQLQFYTNSDKVWNKNHIQMPNGNLVNSFGTLSQVIIIPKPLSSTLYYVITTETQAGVVQPYTMQYHEVDMSLNSGLGDVSTKNNTLNINPTTEQVAATFHSNGIDIWLLTHEYGNNKFLAYLVTSTGISTTPVVSSVGPSHIACTSNMNARGEIKFSPNGNKIAFNGNGVASANNTNILELCDFNTSTGIVSNPISLPFKRGEFGLSFSPDNSKLYCSTWKAFGFTMSDTNFVYQFDLSSGIASTIISSRTILSYIKVPDSYGTLKLAPNGKIYVSKYNFTDLDVINNPNSPGLSSNYIVNGLNLGGSFGTYGLNNYIEYTNYCVPTEVSERFISNRKTIFPNPAKNSFDLDLEKIYIEGTIQIIDAIGALIQTQSIKTTTEKINFNLNSGIYFIKATTKEGVSKTEKLVVE